MPSKQSALDALKEETEKENLPLKETSKNIVFGKGNPDSSIMFIGEAPGKNEDEQGLPFVGAAGKNLDALLNKVGLTLEDIYIANILKYRPPENRDPLPEEIKAHSLSLLRQIEIIKPKVICSLGNYATKFLLSGGDVKSMDLQPGITAIHGQLKLISLNGFQVKLIPLFHPAAIIYNRSLTSLWEEDMKTVKKEKIAGIQAKETAPKKQLRQAKLF